MLTQKQIEFIREFSLLLLKNSGTVFCGAGISVASGLPLWDDILLEAKIELGLPDTFNDLPLIAQYYSANVPGGRQKLENRIKQFISNDAEPNSNHYLLSKLPITEIWTTNYDKLLERAFVNARVYSRDDELLFDKNANEVAIYKMHGSFDIDKTGKYHQLKNDEIIISRDDYVKYPFIYPRMWARLSATFLTNSILFLGLSFNDPNINLLFLLARRKFLTSYKKHFAILKKPKTDYDLKLHTYKLYDLKEIGIETIEIEEYSELPEIIKGLVSKTSPPFAFIGGSYDSKPEADSLCNLIGLRLAEFNIGVISGYGQPGKEVSHSVAENQTIYNSEKILIYFQAKDKEPVIPVRRIGSIKYSGKDRQEMREEMLSKSRFAILIGGGSGTMEEFEIARKNNIPIIPIATFGGTSEAIWKSMIDTLTEYNINGQPIEKSIFQDLANSNNSVILKAIVSIIKQILIL